MNALARGLSTRLAPPAAAFTSPRSGRSSLLLRSPFHHLATKPHGQHGVSLSRRYPRRHRWVSDGGSNGGAAKQTFLQRFLGPKPMPPRNTPRWYAEMGLLCTVFGITGSSTMFLVRPAVSDVLGLEGSFKDGPWSYRICSIVIMTPMYATLLVIVGTVFGRHHYFRHFSVKMFSRFGIPPELMDKNFHKTAKNFRKW